MSIIAEISMGRHDGNLNMIIEAASRRIQTLHRAGIQEGMKVRINDQCRPAYMRGLTGEVVKVNDESVRVFLDAEPPIGPGGRRRFARELRVPMSLVEVVPEEIVRVAVA